MSRYIDADELKEFCKAMGVDCYDEYATFERAINDQPTADVQEVTMANEWISVKERLPDEEQDVLVLIREIEFYGRHKEKRNVYHWVHTGWYIDGEWATTYCFGHKYIREEINDMCDLVVTHWMPLPELPNKNGLK